MLGKNIVLVFVLLICISCGTSSNNDPDSDKVSENEVSRIEIPPIQQGYNYLEITVIRSSSELDQFNIDISNYQYWNDKESFIAALVAKNVDFTNFNIVIFPHTQGDGSTILTPQDPVWEGDNVLINITQNDPAIATGVLTFYAFAYKVSKAVTDVIISINNINTVITNESL